MSLIIEAPSNGGRRKLKRTMGLWTATALVVGRMVGSGVFLLPATLAATARPVSILAWVLTGAGAILLALVFANPGRAFPATGGPYASARRAFVHKAPSPVLVLTRGAHVTGEDAEDVPTTAQASS